MSNHYDGYQHGRETVIRLLQSSFRIRENGFGGIVSDLRIAEDLLRTSADTSPEFRAGVESVVRECRLALRTSGRDYTAHYRRSLLGRSLGQGCGFRQEAPHIAGPPTIVMQAHPQPLIAPEDKQ